MSLGVVTVDVQRMKRNQLRFAASGPPVGQTSSDATLLVPRRYAKTAHGTKPPAVKGTGSRLKAPANPTVERGAAEEAEVGMGEGASHGDYVVCYDASRGRSEAVRVPLNHSPEIVDIKPTTEAPKEIKLRSARLRDAVMRHSTAMRAPADPAARLSTPDRGGVITPDSNMFDYGRPLALNSLFPSRTPNAPPQHSAPQHSVKPESIKRLTSPPHMKPPSKPKPAHQAQAISRNDVTECLKMTCHPVTLSAVAVPVQASNPYDASNLHNLAQHVEASTLAKLHSRVERLLPGVIKTEDAMNDVRPRALSPRSVFLAKQQQHQKAITQLQQKSEAFAPFPRTPRSSLLDHRATSISQQLAYTPPPRRRKKESRRQLHPRESPAILVIEEYKAQKARVV